MASERKYGLGIWWLGLGYYLFYTPYSGLTKALSVGLLPGVGGHVPGTVLLPASVMATTLGMLGFITARGWWRYAGRREFFGLSLPCPRRLTFLSGVCIATIMGTTTLAFTFRGISIVLVLVLLRGGVLVIAPAVDAISGRRVRWFSRAALLVSLLAVSVALADAGSYEMSLGAALNVAAYLAAYFVRFQLMSKLAKTDDRPTSLRYFVEEQMVAAPLLLAALGALAAVGAGEAMQGFRLGFTSFLTSVAVGPALLVGLCYAGLCVCTTLIFLDCRENTFCVPMHCGSSMLSGLTATAALTLLFDQAAPSAAQFVGAALIVVALLFLSPLHHFRRTLGRVRSWLGGLGRPSEVARPLPVMDAHAARRAANDPVNFDRLRRLFLFVCSGNTCRSPMAAAIGNAEIAARLKIPFDDLDTAHARALSAGISARVGAPMTPEAQQALRQLDVPVRPHAARNLTAELAQQVEMIFCMTRAHREAIIEMVPSAAGKTHCLDPEADIEDPLGGGMESYVKCVGRLRSLIRWRLDEARLSAPS